MSQSHFSYTLLEYKDIGKGKKLTHLNEVTYMPSSGLLMLFDKEIQMQEEDSFMKFTSVAVTETFLAGFLCRFFFFFLQNVNVAKKKYFQWKLIWEKGDKEHWACQNLQQISLNVPLWKRLDKMVQSVFGFEMFV